MTSDAGFQNSTTNARSKPLLILHAGTHKTASTYIQERLHLNRDLLKQQSITYQDPCFDRPKAKKLAGELCKYREKRWRRMLSNHKQDQHLLLSAEQFSVPLTNQKCIQNLEELANNFGFKLHIVVFIRSQLDYINSRYIYSLRRFYHSQTFEQFVSDAIEGEMHSEWQQRGRITRRQDVFNFWTYFQPLIEAKKSGLKVSFIPFQQNGNDPFQDLITTIGVAHNQTWEQCTSRHFNRSPGTRGVWMARLLSQKLRENKISTRSIDNSSQIILREEQQRRWKDPAFWGYSRRLKNQVIKYFKNDNDKFAKAAWGTSWATAFPDDIKLLQRKKQIYQPQSIEEEETMHAIAIHLLRRIRHKIKPKFYYRIVDPLERIANFLSPSISLRTIRYVKIHLLQLGKP
jgi:hypothetical protein